MLTLASIAGALAFAAKYVWMLALLLIPQVLDVVKPLLQGFFSGVVNFISTVWQGAKTANFKHWMLVLLVGVAAGIIGYRYGWNAAIDWGHEHYRWIAKKAVSTSWWNFKSWKFW